MRFFMILLTGTGLISGVVSLFLGGPLLLNAISIGVNGFLLTLWIGAWR